jgi:hypothetical protein
MTPKCFVLRALLAGTLAAAAACSETSGPATPTSDDSSDPADITGLLKQSDPDPAALARAVPGFGGLFLDASGTPTVYLKNPSRQRPTAERALAAFSRARGPGGIRVLTGKYGWAELSGWFHQASPAALSVPGAVFVDLDEASNRVRIGVERGVPGGRIRAVLAALGIPDAAVVVSETEPIQFAATLRDRVRPVRGGLQINFSNFLCTLGFNAGHSQGSSFITNSHCTNQQGGTEGTRYSQPLASTGNSFLGTEAADPTYFRRGNGCPGGRRCRFSDAARVAYAGGVSFAVGSIAQTTGPNNGSLTIAGAFNITAEASGNGTVGQNVNKVGRTTGWTRGLITNTCVNTGVSGTNIVQLCQTFVSARVGGGDSGSPVFTAGTAGGNATLNGILWGGNSSGTQFVYSPLANIERELGALATF